MITVVIPALNEDDVIEETLAHLKRGLTHSPHEIIVSDDGSTDQTAIKSQPYAHRIVSYEGQTPKTIGAARNRGARTASNDLLVFLDSDVRLHEPAYFFDRIRSHFQRDPQLVAMTTYARVYPSTETRTDRYVLAFWNTLFWWMNRFGFGVTHGKCMIVRAHAFLEVGGFKEHLVVAEDFELFQRLARIGTTMVDSSLTYYFSGRRAHALGWARLMFLHWIPNGVSVIFFKHSFSEDWRRVDRKISIQNA